mmetsp:Transcript_2796/g.5656  ORF Transcript_2796/g.5656 Transcript_2796/m.5656 type:complete len:86 (+) Transcript_2796:66-323(+)
MRQNDAWFRPHLRKVEESMHRHCSRPKTARSLCLKKFGDNFVVIVEIFHSTHDICCIHQTTKIMKRMNDRSGPIDVHEKRPTETK